MFTENLKFNFCITLSMITELTELLTYVCEATIGVFNQNLKISRSYVSYFFPFCFSKFSMIFST